MGDDHEQAEVKESGDIEGRDIDPDAMAFIKAKRNVDDLQKAKKNEKRIH